jgi:hypothetical protein
MMECPDMYIQPDGKRKRRQRACKVCSILQGVESGDNKRKSTKYFCDACSDGERR